MMWIIQLLSVLDGALAPWVAVTCSTDVWFAVLSIAIVLGLCPRWAAILTALLHIAVCLL